MQCPKCGDKHLVSVLTDVGTEIDACPACKGVWLDRGEIFYFIKGPGEIEKEIEEVIEQGAASERR